VHQFSGRADFGGELLLLFSQDAEITLDLKPVPKLGRLTKEGTKADGHRRGNGALAEHDFVDRSGRHAEGSGMAFREIPIVFKYSSRRISRV